MVNNSSRTVVKAASGLLVTLSAAKGLARWAHRCFAALSMTARAAVKAGPVGSRGQSYLQMSGSLLFYLTTGHFCLRNAPITVGFKFKSTSTSSGVVKAITL